LRSSRRWPASAAAPCTSSPGPTSSTADARGSVRAGAGPGFVHDRRTGPPWNTVS
jgi:hypothetical protein